MTDTMISLSFNPSEKMITIIDSGIVDFLPLYRAIREWEASAQGITHDVILEGSGNIELIDGTRTPRAMIFVNGWKLSSENLISIVDGYVTGRNSEGKYTHPIHYDSIEKIQLLSSDLDEREFVPTEAQKRYAISRGYLFGGDWEVVFEPKPTIRRKLDASTEAYKIFDLYWFLKQEFLRNREMQKYRFPIKSDNRTPEKGLVRRYELAPDWKIIQEDLRYLVEGPLIQDGQELVSADKATIEITQGAAFTDISAHDVTIGIATALEEEYITVNEQLDESKTIVIRKRRQTQTYVVGSIQSIDGGQHKVALVLCDPGNNAAGIRAASLINDFPNLREVIMVGIAGAVPNPEDAENHVRLGDVIVLGMQGVIQYDYIKNEKDRILPRHLPRPPSARLLDATRLIEAELRKGNNPVVNNLARTSHLPNMRLPPESEDRLARSDDKDEFIKHPPDRKRTPDTPRVFIGPIGSANILQKDPMKRDELRDKYGIRAIEMEGSGIGDAAWRFDVGFMIIRGAVDYCDDNKTNDWHDYSAAAAAAYLRALLEMTPYYDLTV